MGSNKLEHNGLTYPIRIHKEWRESVRYSLGNKYLTIRMPKFIPGFLASYHIQCAKDWAVKKIDKRGVSVQAVNKKNYRDGDLFLMREQEFRIQVKESNRKTFKGLIEGETICIETPAGKSDDLESKAKLISRLMANYFKPYIIERINFYNEKYFRTEINDVKLKNNRSNWGSCSSKKNLNFSTRLLFAPDHVVDYVIVHEMAHLKEMNHSKKFWAIVENVMPDYKEKEKWLKDYNHLCHF